MTKPRIALFDLDHTLLPIDSDYSWSEFTQQIGWTDPVEFKRRNDEFYAHYVAGTLDVHDYVRFAVEALRLRGEAAYREAHARFMRDWIDARWNIGEYLLPAMLIGMPMSLLANAQFTIAGLTLIYGIFIAAIIDFVVLWFRLRSRVEAKFGARPKGAAFQMFSRYVQLRPTRVPRARVKRGQYPS